MKKIMTIILLTILPFSMVTGNDIVNNKKGYTEPDAMAPSSTTLFVRISEIEKTIEIITYFMSIFAYNKSFAGFLNWVKIFKSKTNIDLFNAQSLNKVGIDINKPLSLAYIGQKNILPDIYLFIPIKNKTDFYLRFVKILKKISNDIPNLDLNPVITSYKNYKIGQILRDIHFTKIENYFILAPSGNLIKQIIEIKDGEKNDLLLANEPHYREYKEKNNEENEIDIFIKGKFFKEYNFTYNDRDKEIMERNYNTTGDIQLVKSVMPDSNTLKNRELNNAQNVNTIDKSKFDSIKYLGLGLKIESSKVNLKISSSMNINNPYALSLMEIFKTGMAEKALFIDNPLIYFYSSIDTKRLLDLWKNNMNSNLSGNYDILKENIINNLGIDLNDFFSSYSGAFFNFIVKKSKARGELDNFILFFPFEDNPRKKKLWEKTKASMKSRHKKNGGFKEKKSGDIDSFCFKNSRGDKINFIMEKSGFFIGNNIRFMQNTLKNRGKKLLEINNELFKKVDSNTFIISYVKFDRESFVKTILMLLTYSRPQLYNFVNKMDSVSIIGKKLDSDIFFDLKVKFSPVTSGKKNHRPD